MQANNNATASQATWALLVKCAIGYRIRVSRPAHTRTSHIQGIQQRHIDVTKWNSWNRQSQRTTSIMCWNERPSNNNKTFPGRVPYARCSCMCVCMCVCVFEQYLVLVYLFMLCQIVFLLQKLSMSPSYRLPSSVIRTRYEKEKKNLVSVTCRAVYEGVKEIWYICLRTKCTIQIFDGDPLTMCRSTVDTFYCYYFRFKCDQFYYECFSSLSSLSYLLPWLVGYAYVNELWWWAGEKWERIRGR